MKIETNSLASTALLGAVVGAGLITLTRAGSKLISSKLKG